MQHPLSPPLETASRSSFLQDVPANLLESPDSTTGSSPSSTKPLFPPSPTESRNEAESTSRRGSGETVSGKNEIGIGLGFPSITSRTPQDQEEMRPLSPPPSSLTFPSPPHLLQPPTLAALPISHLVALAQSLSRDLELVHADLAARRKELEAIEQLAMEKGASSGEIERVKLRLETKEPEMEQDERVRTLKRRGKERKRETEWRIETGGTEKGIDDQAKVEVSRLCSNSQLPIQLIVYMQVDLDIEDLTEAISSNAFDIATSPVLDSSDETLLRNRTLSLPPPPPPQLNDTASINSDLSVASAPSASLPIPTSSSSTLKPVRGRNASLSARFFGSLGSSSILSAPPPVNPAGLPHSPSNPTLSTTQSSLSAPTAEHNLSSRTPSVTQRNGRSGSIRSVSSAKSNSSRTSDVGSDSSRKGGYSEWFGWKGWNGSAKGTSAVTEEDTREEDAENEDEEESSAQGKGENDTAVGDGNAGVHSEDVTTPVPNRGIEFFGESTSDDLATPTSKRHQAAPATEDPTDSTSTPLRITSPPPSSSTQSSSSRRTSTTTRSTLASTLDEPSSSSQSTLSPRLIATPDNKRISPAMTPPESPTPSRNRSPAPPPSLATRQAIASPTLSTPMTTSTLSTPSVASPRRPLPSQSPKGSQILDLPHASSDSASSVSRSERDDGESFRRGSLQEASIRGKEEEEEHADPQATLKARTKRTGSAPPTFVPGIPLYSAPSTDEARSTDQGYVAVAKGTIGRALGLAASAASAAQATSSTGMIRSSSDGVRRALNDVAAGPRLPSLSLSRYSLFSQPTTSNPSTAASLSSTNSPTVVHATTFAPPPSSGSPITMELDTISAEAAPPSLTLLKPTNVAAQAAEEVDNPEETADDGPLIDRYGFIYDVHSGMELLKENRRRAKERDGTVTKEEGKKKREKKEKDTSNSNGAEPSTSKEPSGIATPTQLEIHPQLDALREAMGLTPTIEGPNVFSPQTEPLSLEFDSSPPSSSNVPPRPPKLVRAPDSNDSTLSRLSGPQSMRALLGQLRNMSDTVERTQQTEWDAFIRKRQTKLAKIKRQQQTALQETNSGSKGKGKLKKERPKTIWGANALAEEKVEESDASREEDWTENLVGVAQMGNEGKSKKEDWNEFKELVRKGIPISYRPK